MDVSTEDFTSPSFFPHDLTATNAPPLVHGFIGSNRVTDFINRFKLTIIQRLVPGLRKDGYSEVVEDASSNSTAGASQPRASGPAPARPQPHAPPAAPERAPYSHIPPTNPLEIGRRDRDPFPANPFAPPPLFPGADGGGMFVGPDHPIFGARGGGGLPGQSPFGAPRGPWGGDGFLPPMGAPPGARFDPVGPGPFPGAFPGSGNPLGGPRGGFPGRGNPDNDEFMPPVSGGLVITCCPSAHQWHRGTCTCERKGGLQKCMYEHVA
jgi:proteasome inhibitor subunit 1 (PI31)